MYNFNKGYYKTQIAADCYGLPPDCHGMPPDCHKMPPDCYEFPLDCLAKFRIPL